LIRPLSSTVTMPWNSRRDAFGGEAFIYGQSDGRRLNRPSMQPRCVQRSSAIE